MRRIRSLYLAGPDQHLEQASSLSSEARLLCEAAGFSVLTPEPEGLTEQDPSEAMAREIYALRVARMRQADAAIANLTPFRGPHCDPSTAFEAGFFSGLGKPVFAYMNVPTEGEAELCARVDAHIGTKPDPRGIIRDAEGAAVEDFGLPEGLMLWAEARRLYVIVTPEPDLDLTGLQLCLEAVKLYSD
jgi:nucleoside 2-deoxyribosyltransferase